MSGIIISSYNLFQRYHDKIPFFHQWMGNGEFWGIDMQIVIEEDINIDNPVVIFLTVRFYSSKTLMPAQKWLLVE